MRVARAGRSDLAEILIDGGAKVNFKGKDGASALTVAAAHGNTEVARILLGLTRHIAIAEMLRAAGARE
jgi:ankyrin repeat protein